jgi:hypothetical protein
MSRAKGLTPNHAFVVALREYEHACQDLEAAASRLREAALKAAICDDLVRHLKGEVARRLGAVPATGARGSAA